MRLIEQIIDKLGRKPEEPDHDPVRQLLDEGQQAKRAEDYELALTKLVEAERLAEAKSEFSTLAIILLHRAETLIALEQWSEAENLLLRLRHQAQTSSLRTPLCYALCTLGTLEQARGNQEEARAYYAQALKVARAAASVGGEGRALAHLADTYLQENNASYAVHLLRDALPRLNMSGDIEWSSYFVGQLGRGLILSGHEAEGERLLYRALRIAEQMKHIRLERQWALLLAGRAAEGMRYEEALRLYRQALPLLRDDASTRTR